jgi:TonB family protein
MPFQRQILLSSDPVPRKGLIWLSFCCHLVALVLMVALRHATAVRFVSQQYATVQVISGAVHLSVNPPRTKNAQAPTSPLLRRRALRQTRVPSNGSVLQGAALHVLREHAKQATAGMIDSIRVSQFYGLHLTDYQLAVQTAGKLPYISAAEVPPRFEQLVTVEVTIDTDGRVADAQIVGGEISAAIQHKLLTAVREFRYSPATHDGSPIPSQVDIIIHIPSLDAG